MLSIHLKLTKIPVHGITSLRPELLKNGISCVVLLTILCVSNLLFVLFANPDFLVKSKVIVIVIGCKYISNDGCSSKFGRLLFFYCVGSFIEILTTDHRSVNKEPHPHRKLVKLPLGYTI